MVVRMCLGRVLLQKQSGSLAIEIGQQLRVIACLIGTECIAGLRGGLLKHGVFHLNVVLKLKRLAYTVYSVVVSGLGDDVADCTPAELLLLLPIGQLG